ncbi:MFS transporter [Oenococcus sp. UCMA 17063]|nr:MFS transporter [Oenococcus sp. UCMA 17063]
MFKNKLVLLASFFTNMGIVLIMPITTLFIHKTLNKSLVVAGFVLMIFSVAMMVGNLLGGFLFDHWKEKLSMYLGGTLIIISLGLITLFPIWAVYSLLVVIYGVGLGILNSNINGYIAFLKSDDQQIFNNNYWLASMGSGIASFLSGILFAINIRLVFGFSTILFIVTLIIIKIGFHHIEKTKATSKNTKNNFHSSYTGRIICVCFGLVVAWIGYEQWDSNISTLMISKGISVRAYSILFTINAAVLLVFQPLTKLIFKNSFFNDKLRVIVGIFIFSISYLLIIDTSQYWRFVLGIIVLTFGEILVFPAIPSLLNRYASDSNRGIIQSFGSLAGSLGRAIGPIVGGYIVTDFNYQFLFFAIFFLHVLSIIIFLPLKSN